VEQEHVITYCKGWFEQTKIKTYQSRMSTREISKFSKEFSV